MIRSTALHVRLLGDTRRAEFRHAAELLAAETVLVNHAKDRDVDLYVVAQSRPGEFSSQQMDALRRARPTVPIVALLGSWCEGETRTGYPWPADARVFWYEFSDWWRGCRQSLRNGHCPSWGLPLTVTEEERLLAGPSAALPRSRGLVAIATRRSATADALADACSIQGWATAWLRPGLGDSIRGASAVVWEGVQLGPAEMDELAQLATRFPHVPRVALLDFPRAETRDRASAAGVTHVLAKPFVLGDLFAALAPQATIEHPARQSQAA